MRLWIAYVQDLSVAFVPAIHCREEDSGYAFTMRETEGAIATIDVERRRTGLDILRSSQPKCAIVSWSETGDPADAVVLARARIVGLPEDLFAPTQTVTLECAPADIDERMLDWCRTHLADGPETDLLFADADPESVETWLLGRSGSLVVDPATHEISYADDLVGDTVHDLADMAFVQSSGRGVYDPPVRTYRAVLTCEWTQEAEGTVDVASRLSGLGVVTTLDAGFAGRIESALSTSGAEGWSTTGGVETSIRISETLSQEIGSVYESYRIKKRSVPDVSAGQDIIVQEADPPIIAQHSVAPVFLQHTVRIKRFPLAYAYAQARRDVAYLALAAPIQDTAAIRDDDIEAFEWSIGDIFRDETIPAWAEGEDYVAGDETTYGGRYYECVADHRSTFFDADRGVVYRRRIPGIDQAVYDVTRTFWLRIRPTRIPTPAGMTAFLSTARGQRCVRHALLRLRKEARRRLRAWHVTIEAAWQDAHQVGIRDSVSILVPWDDQGVQRRVVGRIVGIERVWTGESAPLLRIEIGIPFGVGGSPGGGTADAYAEPGYADDYLGDADASDLDVHVAADPAVVPVDAPRLVSPGYAVLRGDIRNHASDQIAAIGDVLAAGGDITEISVRKPTSIKLTMRSLAASPEPLEREIDVYATLLVTPAGVDLT